MVGHEMDYVGSFLMCGSGAGREGKKKGREGGEGSKALAILTFTYQ